MHGADSRLRCDKGRHRASVAAPNLNERQPPCDVICLVLREDVAHSLTQQIKGFTYPQHAFPTAPKKHVGEGHDLSAGLSR